MVEYFKSIYRGRLSFFLSFSFSFSFFLFFSFFFLLFFFFFFCGVCTCGCFSTQSTPLDTPVTCQKIIPKSELDHASLTHQVWAVTCQYTKEKEKKKEKKKKKTLTGNSHIIASHQTETLKSQVDQASPAYEFGPCVTCHYREKQRNLQRLKTSIF